MSERTGDKSRFGRQRRTKILRRKLARELRKVLDMKEHATSTPLVPKNLVFVG